MSHPQGPLGLPRRRQALDLNAVRMSHCPGQIVAFPQSGALTEKLRRDAEHIAAATVVGVSVVAIWNFRRIQRYNDVNRDAGYAPLDIRNPMELENDE